MVLFSSKISVNRNVMGSTVLVCDMIYNVFLIGLPSKGLWRRSPQSSSLESHTSWPCLTACSLLGMISSSMITESWQFFKKNQFLALFWAAILINVMILWKVWFALCVTEQSACVDDKRDRCCYRIRLRDYLSHLCTKQGEGEDAWTANSCTECFCNCCVCFSLCSPWKWEEALLWYCCYCLLHRYVRFTFDNHSKSSMLMVECSTRNFGNEIKT